MNHEQAMRSAIAEASASGSDVPVGALILNQDGEVVARAHNVREAENDPTGHAEIVAIREAAEALGTWRLDNLTLVVTLEPCAWDDRVGASGSLYDVLRDARLGQPVEVISGVLQEQCASQLRAFFESRR